MMNDDSERQPLLSNTKHQHQTNNGHKSHSHESDLEEHKHLLNNALYPADAFSGTSYWADLPASEQLLWVKNKARKEARREYAAVKQLAKAGILRPFWEYCRTYAFPGAGFFVEGYVLFSVGNIMPLFKAVWPQCFDETIVCSEQSIKAIKYMEIVGILCGQLVVGYLGDAIGRRWGLIQDVCIMLVGTILLTSMWGLSLQGWTIMYAISIFVFGLGVGGEYPMTGTSSIEGMKGAEDRQHRGRSACLAFLMQGWGQLANQVVLILLTVATNSSHSLQPPYSEQETQITFRVSFAIAALCLLYFLRLRIKNTNVDSGIRANRTDNKDAGYDWVSFKFVLSRFWARLLASSLCWFCSDFAFYGMQIFRNDLLQLVTGTSARDASTIWLYNLINIFCQLVGYYMAALFIDYKPYGRRRMQTCGFFAQFVIYATISFLYPVLSQPGPGAKAFQALYFLANFWVQFGPNSTTFLLAAEIFPIGIRSTAHGFSAAVGKVGALVATVSFAYIGDRTKFILAAVSMLVGLLLTLVFVPDTTGLDLAEMQRAWGFVTQGDVADYHGVAVHRQHLSTWERLVRKRMKNYEIDSDRKQRLDELREMYAKSIEDMNRANHEGGEIDEGLVRYFELEAKLRREGLETAPG
jgi:MFS family permease